jgi:PHD/YefM family antitoxin component YafN of YafNO toxin-antitoxin module
MQSITASEIKQNSTLLQNALKSDMLITKREKPFVVVVDYDRYLELTNKQAKSNNWIEKSFAVMSEVDADVLMEDIVQSRVNKEIDLWS